MSSYLARSKIYSLIFYTETFSCAPLKKWSWLEKVQRTPQLSTFWRNNRIRCNYNSSLSPLEVKRALWGGPKKKISIKYTIPATAAFSQSNFKLRRAIFHRSLASRLIGPNAPKCFQSFALSRGLLLSAIRPLHTPLCPFSRSFHSFFLSIKHTRFIRFSLLLFFCSYVYFASRAFLRKSFPVYAYYARSFFYPQRVARAFVV